jgi:DivIVA domain-containing protein
MLNPRDIEQKVFTVVRLREGYSQPEVDDFLDQVVTSYSQVYAELDGYKKVRLEAEEAPTQVIPLVEPELMAASRIVQVAERTAEEMIEDAKATALEIIEDGKRERHALMGEMEERKARLQAQLNELAVAQSNVQRRLKAALEAINEAG